MAWANGERGLGEMRRSIRNNPRGVLRNKRGRTVFYEVRAGANPKTPNQTAARNCLSAASPVWKAMGEAGQGPWNRYAARHGDRFGDQLYKNVSGWDIFQAAFRNRTMLELAAPVSPSDAPPPRAVLAIEEVASTGPAEFRFRVKHRERAEGHALLVRITPATRSRGCKPNPHRARMICGYTRDSLVALPTSGGTIVIPRAQFAIAPGRRFGVEMRIVRVADGVHSPERFVDLFRLEPVSPEPAPQPMEGRKTSAAEAGYSVESRSRKGATNAKSAFVSSAVLCNTNPVSNSGVRQKRDSQEPEMMNGMLRNAVMLAAILLTVPMCVRPGAAETTTPQGLELYAMDTAIRRLPGTVEDRLDVVKGCRYAGVSWNGTDVPEIERVIAAAKERGLRMHALYLKCPVTTGGIELPGHFDELCAALGRHGALLWFYTESKAFKPSALEGDAVAVPALQAAADRAGRHGVRVALYPHRDYWVETFADAIRVADKVNRPNFGVSFNLCHSLYAGEEEKIPDLLRRAGGRLFMVTINGADSGAAKGSWDRLIRPLGEGSYDVAGLVKLLKEIGYRGSIGFQAFGLKQDPLEILRVTMTEWKRLNLE